MNQSNFHDAALADCAHCGCKAEIVSFRVGRKTRMVQIRCQEAMCCDTRGPRHYTIKEAIEAWNVMFLNTHEGRS
jgi:hypothetical protein